MQLKFYLISRDEAVINRKQSQLEAIGNADLIENISDVMLDGLFADGELLGNIAIRKTRHDGAHNIQFAAGQSESFLGILIDRRHIGPQGFNQVGHLMISNPEVALHNCTDAAEEDGCGRIL